MITKGPYAGEKAEVDHIVPIAVAPHCGNWLSNLEFMPRTLNRWKSDKLTERGASLFKKLLAASTDVGRRDTRRPKMTSSSAPDKKPQL